MIGKTLTLTSAGLAAALLWPAEVVAGTGSWQQERAAAIAAYSAGNYGDAEARLLDAIDRTKSFGPNDPRLAATLNDLALTYFRLGRYTEAEPLHKRALEIRERTYGMDDPKVAAILNDLAFLYVAQGRTTEAGPLHGRALAIREKAYGPTHPAIAESLNNIGGLYLELDRYAEAEVYFVRALGIVGESLGENHPFTIASLNNLAAVYDEQGRYREAEPLYKKTLGIAEEILGEHPQVAASLNNLAKLYDTQGKLDDAEPVYRKALGMAEKTLGPEHPDVAASLEGEDLPGAIEACAKSPSPLAAVMLCGLNKYRKMLLKGHSHKRIARLTERSDRTVRQHAVAVYRKAGLAGRSELSGFFLEGLFSPASEAEASSSAGTDSP